MITYDKAIRIAKEFANEIASSFAGKIIAVVAIGSLGSDYYRTGQSDIDTAIITSYNRSEIKRPAEKIKKIAQKYWKEYNVPKGFGAIVFSNEQLVPPYIKEEELILEIFRLKTQSKLIYGSFDTEKIPFPDKRAIINDAISFQEWVDSEKEKDKAERHFSIQESDAASLVNSTLIALKRYLLIKHDIIEFNKFKVVGLYLENNPPIVNNEVFDFVESYLHDNNVQVANDKLSRMIVWHDELYNVINNLVLYN